jgi:hypothetical protein
MQNEILGVEQQQSFWLPLVYATLACVTVFAMSRVVYKYMKNNHKLDTVIENDL